MRVGVLTVSDGVARGVREDGSGDLLEAWAQEEGRVLAQRAVVVDETSAIVPILLHWCDGGLVDLIVTTGGTGFSPRDVTPEATLAVADRVVPGIPELLRTEGRNSTPLAVLSRGVAAIRGGTLLVNLPGSRGGVQEGIEALAGVVAHAVAITSDRATFHSPGAPPAQETMGRRR